RTHVEHHRLYRPPRRQGRQVLDARQPRESNRVMSAAAEAGGPARTFGASARASVLWGGGFTLFRDVLQFATLIVLVRHVMPDDYGRAALAQTILGLLSVASFSTCSPYARQAPAPANRGQRVQPEATAVMK